MRRNGIRTRAARIAASAILTAATLGVAGVSLAGPHGRKCGGEHGRLERLERDVAGLGLAQTELDAVYQVLDQARKERRALDGGIHSACDRLRELLDRDEPNVETVTAQADTIGELMTKARKIELRATVQVRSMLTPEQRKQLGRLGERSRRHAPGPEL